MNPRTADRIAQVRARWLPACTRRPDLWWSTDAEDRWYAEQHCAACPMRAACAERGRDEPEGVWGGESVGDRLLLLEPARRAVEHVASRGCYIGGCRRPECTEANRRWIAEWRQRTAVTEAPRIEAFEQLAMEVGA